jgi:hypothetical protein
MKVIEPVGKSFVFQYHTRHLQEAAIRVATIITRNRVATIITRNNQVLRLRQAEMEGQVELLGLAEKADMAEPTYSIVPVVPVPVRKGIKILLSSSAVAVALALAVTIKQLMAEMPMAVMSVTPMVETLAHKYLHRPREENKFQNGIFFLNIDLCQEFINQNTPACDC